MIIDSIEVKNFKSIKHTEVNFNSLNILIGKNAAGKSNFLELFQFLNDVESQGIEDAIQLRGGIEYFRNTKIADTEDFELTINFVRREKDPKRFRVTNDEKIGISDPISTEYNIVIEFDEDSYNISKEEITNQRIIIDREKDNEKTRVTHELYREEGHLKREKYGYDDEISEYSEEHLAPMMSEREIGKNQSMLSLGIPIRGRLGGIRQLTDLTIYDIDPVQIKQGTTLKGKRELESNGNNLPLVLKEIVSSSDEKEKFLNLIGDILPFIKDWETDTLRDKSVFLKILEEFEDQDQEYLPADLVSDGTINAIAIIIILYFENKRIAMVEEPERNMHPALISKIVRMMEDVSENTNKQVFTTTHNVELIKNASTDDILFVNRDDRGFTEINRPSNDEHIRQFLEQGMGLEELYVKNILESEL